MVDKISAGIIPYRIRNGDRQYLVLKSRTGDWEFPKGTIENNESYEQAALRELYEETGIKNIELIDDFEKEYTYDFKIGNQNVNKKVYLYIGCVSNDNVNLSNEHSDYQWCDYQNTYNTLTHKSVSNILEDANQYMVENNN